MAKVYKEFIYIEKYHARMSAKEGLWYEHGSNIFNPLHAWRVKKNALNDNRDKALLHSYVI